MILKWSGSGEGSEVEPVQDEVGLPAVTGVVETSNICPENPTRDEFGQVGVRLLERVDSCFLANLYIMSGWVKDKLGMDACESFQKWNCFDLLCIRRPE